MLAGAAAAAGSGPLIPRQPSRPPPGPALSKPATRFGSIAPQGLPPLKLPQHFENDPTVVQEQLRQLIEQAIATNPDLQAAQYAAQAAGHRVLPAGVPEDPYLGYRMKDLPTNFSMTQENATEKQIEITQRYPFPGKLTLRREAAGKQAEVARADARIARLHLITVVRLAFADIFVVDKDIQLVLEQQRMLRQLRDIATSKYRLGPGLQQDVLNADVALAQLNTTLVELTRRRDSRLIRLAVLLNRPSVEVEPLGTLPLAQLRFPAEQLEEMTLASNPEVQRLGRAVERDTLNERLAARAPLPDIVLYMAYGSRNDPPDQTTVTYDHGVPIVTQTKAPNRIDLMTGQIMFDIPIFYFSKQREQLFDAQATLGRTRARLVAARDTALGMLHDLLARLAEHEDTARSYQQEVIPLARGEVNAAISAYRVDKVDFLTLLAAQDNLEKYETAYWHNEADRYRDLAQIDEVTGEGIGEAGATR
jgi:cobalt-zinc-cadmium efflux system outer membrane protein